MDEETTNALMELIIIRNKLLKSVTDKITISTLFDLNELDGFLYKYYDELSEISK